MLARLVDRSSYVDATSRLWVAWALRALHFADFTHYEAYVFPFGYLRKVNVFKPFQTISEISNIYSGFGKIYSFSLTFQQIVFIRFCQGSANQFTGGSGPPRSSIGRFRVALLVKHIVKHIVAKCYAVDRTVDAPLPHSMSCPRLRSLRKATQMMGG